MADQTQGQQGQGTGDAAQPADGTTSATTTATAGQAGRTFTQEDLNRQIDDRLRRERAKFADYESLKAAAAELGKLKQDQMTEAQRLQAQLEAATKENVSLKALAQLSQARAAAATAGALYPDLVAAKIPPEALSDEKKLASAIKDLRSQYPAMFSARAAGGGTADGGAGGQPASMSMNEWIRRSAGRE